MLKKLLLLTDASDTALKKSILSSFLAQLSLSLPVMILMITFVEILQPFWGGVVEWNKLWILAAFSVAVVLLAFAAHRYEYGKTYVAAYEAAGEKRTSLAEHLRKLPLSYFGKKDLTEITVNMMSDCGTIEQSFSSIIPAFGGTLLNLLLTCVLLAVFDWRMALAIFISVPVSFGFLLLCRKTHNRIGKEHLQSKLDASGQMQEYLEGMKVIKAFGLGGDNFKSLEDAYRRLMKVSTKTETINGALTTASMMMLRFGIPLSIFVGLNLVTSGSLELLYFLMFLLFSSRIYTSLSTPLALWGDLLYALLSIKRLHSVYEEKPMTGNDAAVLNSYEIEFDHVSFGYQEESVIKDVSFRIPQGKVTALVGPSGSGKSTISKLIARFWDVNGGSIRIGGTDIREIDPERLLTWVSFVFQEVVLFNDSIYNNIAIGRTGATREEIEEAARRANCHEFVHRLPGGYETLVGENGCTLSGGERQRISIARALLKDAPIILLDEATACLDPENELEIQEALSQLIQDKTVVVIAHRLRTIAGADNIVVLENGRVAQQGSGPQLLKADGLYARLFGIQQQNAGWGVEKHSGEQPAGNGR
ncbi:MAG: ABC transporter ATP-binding protein [Oscillospiraceae bacterium]